MRDDLEQRAKELALYMIENRTTVRAAAKKFGVSKSTVHKDLSERLALCDRALYTQVKAILDENRSQRHIPAEWPRAASIRGYEKRDGGAVPFPV